MLHLHLSHTAFSACCWVFLGCCGTRGAGNLKGAHADRVAFAVYNIFHFSYFRLYNEDQKQRGEIQLDF